MGLVLDWKRKLGYKKDPFFDEQENDLIGLEKLREMINLFLIKNERLCVIKGPEGSGKSSFINWLDGELTKQGMKTIIVSGKISSKEKLINQVYNKMFSLIERQIHNWRKLNDKKKLIIEKLKKKNIILIIDDADALSKAQNDLLHEIMAEANPVIIATGKNEVPFKRAQLKYTITPYSSDELIEILRKRIADAEGVGLFPFKEKQLEKLAKKAEGNPRRFLAEAKELAIELSLKVEGPPPKEDKKKENKNKNDNKKDNKVIKENKREDDRLNPKNAIPKGGKHDSFDLDAIEAETINGNHRKDNSRKRKSKKIGFIRFEYESDDDVVDRNPEEEIEVGTDESAESDLLEDAALLDEIIKNTVNDDQVKK